MNSCRRGTASSLESTYIVLVVEDAALASTGGVRVSATGCSGAGTPFPFEPFQPNLSRIVRF